MNKIVDVMMAYINTVSPHAKAYWAKRREMVEEENYFRNEANKQSLDFYLKDQETIMKRLRQDKIRLHEEFVYAEAKADLETPFIVLKTYEDLAKCFDKNASKYVFPENTLIIAAAPENDVVMRGGISSIGLGSCNTEAHKSLAIYFDRSDSLWNDFTVAGDFVIAGKEVNVLGNVNVGGSLHLLPIYMFDQEGISFRKQVVADGDINIDPRISPNRDTWWGRPVHFLRSCSLNAGGKINDPEKLSNFYGGSVHEGSASGAVGTRIGDKGPAGNRGNLTDLEGGEPEMGGKN
ncbi:MAG: hypothetical protein FWE53_01520 [Firmicutes bacterium]|nr:hypothetical protein [Bacillota bacterium]